MQNEEKCISFTKSFHMTTVTDCKGETREKFVNFIFKDSFRFLASSLDKLAKSLDKTDFTSFETKYVADWELLTRKQVFPYRFLDCLEKLGHEGIIPIEEFGSQLGEGELFEGNNTKGVEVRPISREDHDHYKKVMSVFGCKTFGEYVRLYCELDVELLSIVFEKFIDQSLADFGIDPSHSYTSAGFFWETMLKSMGVKLELLTDPTTYNFFEQSIQGGVSIISNRFANANNKYLASYDEQKESSYIVDLDANGLYASTMLEPLPVGGFKWMGKEEKGVILT